MTLNISTHKVTRILRYYFRGMTQTDIARKVGVNQSTVSLYSRLFARRSKQYGLEAVGREFDVYDEVIALRSLAVELYNAKLTTEDARQGTRIIHKFFKLGVEPDRHIDLIKVCKEIDNREFIQCTIRLMEIEHGSNLSYEETIQRFQETAMSLPAAETKLQKLREELKHLSEHEANKRQTLTNLESQLAQFQKEVDIRKAQLKREIEDNMQRSKVIQVEIQEARDLKNLLNKQGLDITTLVALAKEFQG